jgi:hypothetical protein
MIALTPPAVVDAMRDPEITGTTRRMYDWCVLHLDFHQYRPVKLSALPVERNRAGKCVAALVALGYLDKRQRPAHEPDEYRLLWSKLPGCKLS